MKRVDLLRFLVCFDLAMQADYHNKVEVIEPDETGTMNYSSIHHAEEKPSPSFSSVSC